MHIIAPAPYIGISWRKYSVSLSVNAEAKVTAAHITAMAITVRLHFVIIPFFNAIAILNIYSDQTRCQNYVWKEDFLEVDAFVL